VGQAGAAVSYGPVPWQQTQWDWRAAGNFMCGGAGSGLIVFTALSGVQGVPLTALIVSGLALVGLGLFCVWLEIGRPWRALNVYFNPRTSWMSREAITALLLFPCGLAAAIAVPSLVPLTAVLALFFLFCQGRMLRAARGIPAWREPLASSLIAVTGLTEGAALFFLSAPLHQAGTRPLLTVFGVLLLARVLLWLAYRRRLAARAAPRAQAALDRAGRWLQFAGTLLPLALITIAATGAVSLAALALLLVLAGIPAVLAGSYMKYTLITRAGFNQGFALTHLPVRGAPHQEQPWA
jgi:phenylacetyl-CoA:acceptor oxidoreductase subunit 2